jgi:hypothetical protein
LQGELIRIRGAMQDMPHVAASLEKLLHACETAKAMDYAVLLFAD